MRAIVCRELGPPSVLRLEELPEPSMGPGQARVKINAAGINFPDILTVEGVYQHKPSLPFIAGFETAGEVIETAADVENVKPGDRVLMGVRPGGFAEQAVVDADILLPTPEPFDDVTAAAFRVTYITAYHCLLQRGGLKAGEWVLINGATGGVGLAAVEIAKIHGAKIIATGGDDGKLEVVRKYGADHVINYQNGPFRDQVKKITGGNGVNLVYDPVGGDVFDQSLRCMAWHGRLVVVGFTSGRIPEMSINYALIKGLSIIGCRAGEARRNDPEAGDKELADVLALANAGKLHPYVSHVLPFENAIEGMQLLMDRKVVGKVVLTMG
ncbi:MAG: NADPH:quinone oxidoreductase family protein [Rhodospirillaceae bacterium]|jgi:NADPH:quinone reductase|nr:NADPH:quinone oxidoreductase family protein [Rhodospirillaceae bacterium]MBT4042282.1 NADPH:quinone oxidoreductase family protein [Rhodospirillaceae bacterium]MBT4690821.1 NADPH:quinone oxidoreductase family protein [Rhodospirillaceae bacterium]MBT5081598.1 NADPH:quinone oxidoreductase family protein [Rhodospirillaceae bacterium]MBT5527040.1 NADPH:quinone oxidoreductase family protein [Rhodospirillaceae bacterium]